MNPTDQAIDRDQLLTRVMGNTVLADRLLDKFVAASPAECDMMETAARMGDRRLLASTAHRHKGTAATMAAPRVMALAAELEQTASDGETQRWLDLIEQLRALHSEVRQTLTTVPGGRTCLLGQGDRQ